MKIFSIVTVFAMTMAGEAWACPRGCSAPIPAICTNGVAKRTVKHFVVTRSSVDQYPTTTLSPALTAQASAVAAAANITTNFIRETVREVVVQPVVVQPVVVQQQPVYAPQPTYVERVYSTPGRVGIVNLPFVASVGVGISTYPSYYNTGTYWQYDSACQERYNIRANQMGYRQVFGGGRQSVGDVYGHVGRRR